MSAGALATGRIDFRVTYEEQCSQHRSHYHFETRAKNTPLEDVIEEFPIQDACPKCGGPVIGLPNRTVIDS